MTTDERNPLLGADNEYNYLPSPQGASINANTMNQKSAYEKWA